MEKWKVTSLLLRRLFTYAVFALVKQLTYQREIYLYQLLFNKRNAFMIVDDGLMWRSSRMLGQFAKWQVLLQTTVGLFTRLL